MSDDTSLDPRQVPNLQESAVDLYAALGLLVFRAQAVLEGRAPMISLTDAFEIGKQALAKAQGKDRL
jgi:hypothetical protein